MSGDDPVTPKRKALQRLLRRRARRVKPGANSGEPVKSWGEYQSVDITPSTDTAYASVITVIIIFLGFFITIAAFGWAYSAEDENGWKRFDLSWMGDAFLIGLIVVVLLTTLTVACVIIYSFVQIVLNKDK